jgi:hypothetical protein
MGGMGFIDTAECEIMRNSARVAHLYRESSGVAGTPAGTHGTGLATGSEAPPWVSIQLAVTARSAARSDWPLN